MNFKETKGYFWEGKKVILRPLSSGDWEVWYRESTDCDGIRVLNSGVELPVSESMAKEWNEKYMDFKNTNGFIIFSIEDTEGNLVGGINIHSMDQKNGVFSPGLRIYRPYRRKGYSEDALRIILRYGFFELRYQKCNSGCIETNIPSVRLHRNLGFKEEGKRRRIMYTNGRYHDELLFGLTVEEFEENEKEHLKITN